MRSRSMLLAVAGIAGAVAAVALATSARAATPPEVAAHVDLQRYLGTWYEIASIPNAFQRHCTATTATYTLREDGTIEVLNQCRKGGLDGRPARARGKAWVVDEATHAKLKVQFFWPFRGDYWILEVGEAYDYAIVGSPTRRYAWILCRTPEMAPDRFEAALGTLRAQGFDPDALVRTEQPVGGV